MKLYNTSSHQIEDLVPLKDNVFTFYACGPTVYDLTHIGHLRTQVNNDLLRRTLIYLGAEVKQVMNITDVGHLTGDTDEGEDKLEKGAKKTGTTVWEVAKEFTDQFLDSVKAVNVLPPDHLIRATDHIEVIINLIKVLKEKGFVYRTGEAIYFDTSKFDTYGALSGQKLDDKIQQGRTEVYIDKDKKHPADFAVWFFTVGRFQKHEMAWDSPWGKGFPGWHIECSAMSMKYLGPTLDIHAGGIDLIPVHHENEIAQSEAATGQPFVRHWFHSQFLIVDGEKMAKSKQNYFTIEDIENKGFDPMALRYLFLQTHYRKELNFTWESLKAAQTALKKLRSTIVILKNASPRPPISEEKIAIVQKLTSHFVDSLSSDLNLPQALSTVWETIKSNIPSSDKLELLLDFDRVLGLGLAELDVEPIKLPTIITEMQKEYEQARQAKNYSQSDTLRQKAEKQGYRFEDSSTGTIIKKVH